MSRIRILPEAVAVKIAAGEIIERPASVIRELIDNSLDAGAEQISVRIQKGGKALVRVADNGMGMGRDDLLLCVERHATSKIARAEDLQSVCTMGFRGEALPSIAAVSRLEILSRPHGELVGHRLKMAGGTFMGVEESGAPPGTIVEVRDLFFNLPARRRFLRSEKVEARQATEAFSRGALPWLDRTFLLEDGGKRLLHLPRTEDLLTRIALLMGRPVAESMTMLEYREEAFRLWGYLAHPQWSRSRADRVLLYVNQRHVRDPMVLRAVLEAYGGRLMKGQYPHAVILMEMDPGGVDVNVHPSKMEVRFREGPQIFQKIRSTVQKALSGAPKAFTLKGEMEKRDPSPWYEGTPPLPGLSEGQGVYEVPFQREPGVSPEEEGEEVLGGPGEREAEEGFRLIGQLAEAYILCEDGEGLTIVDQHAAHERILFDELKRGVSEGSLPAQSLLLPLTLELPIQERDAVPRHRERLLRLGLDLEPFGGGTFLLRRVPAMLQGVAWEAFVPRLLSALEGEGGKEETEILDRALAVMACHGAVRSGTRLQEAEMERLLLDLKEKGGLGHCPHGRPISYRITLKELEKMFRRVL